METVKYLAVFLVVLRVNLRTTLANFLLSLFCLRSLICLFSSLLLLCFLSRCCGSSFLFLLSLRFSVLSSSLTNFVAKNIVTPRLLYLDVQTLLLNVVLERCSVHSVKLVTLVSFLSSFLGSFFLFLLSLNLLSKSVFVCVVVSVICFRSLRSGSTLLYKTFSNLNKGVGVFFLHSLNSVFVQNSKQRFACFFFILCVDVKSLNSFCGFRVHFCCHNAYNF